MIEPNDPGWFGTDEQPGFLGGLMQVKDYFNFLLLYNFLAWQLLD